MQELSCQLQDTAALPARRKTAYLRSLAGLLLLGAALSRVDAASLVARLSQLRIGYVLLGASLAVPQLGLLALRWRCTARSLGQRLTPREALREYSLALLLNQVLPLGLLGDGLRVVRQARRQRESAWAGALHAVLLERGVGQLMLLLWALCALPLWLGTRGVWIALALIAAAWLVARAARALPEERALPASAWREQLVLLGLALRRVAASGRTLALLLSASGLVLLSIAGQLYCALWSIDLSLSPLTAAKVFPMLLLSMSVPLSFAGFGPREAAAAGLYGALQLSEADGLAFSVAYGTVLLFSSLPCLGLALWLGRKERQA